MKKLLIVVVVVLLTILFSANSLGTVQADWCDIPDDLPEAGIVCP